MLGTFGEVEGLWTSGFDLLYSCQDADFDREQGLHSLPARFGVPAALGVARFLHGAAFLSLLTFGWVAELGPAYFSSVAPSSITA